jgi:hypothetical protein
MDRKWRITRLTALPGYVPELQCIIVEAITLQDALNQNPHGASDSSIIKVEQLANDE